MTYKDIIALQDDRTIKSLILYTLVVKFFGSSTIDNLAKYLDLTPVQVALAVQRNPYIIRGERNLNTGELVKNKKTTKIHFIGFDIQPDLPDYIPIYTMEYKDCSTIKGILALYILKTRSVPDYDTWVKFLEVNSFMKSSLHTIKRNNFYSMRKVVVHDLKEYI